MYIGRIMFIGFCLAATSVASLVSVAYAASGQDYVALTGSHSTGPQKSCGAFCGQYWNHAFHCDSVDVCCGWLNCANNTSGGGCCDTFQECDIDWTTSPPSWSCEHSW